MRSLLALLACLMLVFTAWSGTAQAASPACSEMTDQVAMHVTGDCDEVPADVDRNYPHCHTGCHGHHIAAPVPTRVPGASFLSFRAYTRAAEPELTAHQVDQTLRPPQA